MTDPVRQFSIALSSLRIYARRISAYLCGASAGCLADLGSVAQPKPRLLFCRKKEAKNASAAEIWLHFQGRQEKSFQIEDEILPTQIDIEPKK